MVIIPKGASIEHQCVSRKLEVALDVGKRVPFRSNIQIKCDG